MALLCSSISDASAILIQDVQQVRNDGVPSAYRARQRAPARGQIYLAPVRHASGDREGKLPAGQLFHGG